jgi:hypothetical protein
MYGCAKHIGLRSVGDCGHCGLAFCEDCLVFPFGNKKPPMCVGCALALSGVTHKGQRPRVVRPKLSWRQRRRVARHSTPATPPMPSHS